MTTRARPGTEIEALLQNGRCRNVFFSTNMRRCLGYRGGGIAAGALPRFEVPWWFRTDFHGYPQARQHAVLIMNGVIGQADVWVNGHRIAAASTVTGAFTRFAFPISRAATGGAELAGHRDAPEQSEPHVHVGRRGLRTRFHQTTTPASSFLSSCRWRVRSRMGTLT